MKTEELQNRLKAAEAEIAEVRQLMQEQEEAKTKTPKWKDLEEIKGFYINPFAQIIEYGFEKSWQPLINSNENTFPTFEQAEATLAEAQLLQLRDSKFYRNGWKPDWSKHSSKYAVYLADNGLSVSSCISFVEIWSFQDEETAEQFLNDQRELLEVWAKKIRS